MTSASVALPRRIARRIRPPSAWTVYWALMCAVTLGFIAHAIVAISIDHLIGGVTTAIWSLSYVSCRRHYQAARRLERTPNVTLPPVPRWYWAWLAGLAAFQALAWLTI